MFKFSFVVPIRFQQKWWGEFVEVSIRFIVCDHVLNSHYHCFRKHLYHKEKFHADQKVNVCFMQFALVPCKGIIVFLLPWRLFILPSILFKLFFFHSFFRLFANFSKLESKELATECTFKVTRHWNIQKFLNKSSWIKRDRFFCFLKIIIRFWKTAHLPLP